MESNSRRKTTKEKKKSGVMRTVLDLNRVFCRRSRASGEKTNIYKGKNNGLTNMNGEELY